MANRIPASCGISAPWRNLPNGMMSASLPPIAAQSRRASSSSLSEADSHSARWRPRSQWSRMMRATWRPLPQPVPSPSIQPRRKRTGADSTSAVAGGIRIRFKTGACCVSVIGGLRDAIAVIIFIVGNTRDGLPALADAIERGKMAAMGLTGEDDTFELGRRRAVRPLRYVWAASGGRPARDGYRRHGGGLHQRRWMFAGAGMSAVRGRQGS